MSRKTDRAKFGPDSKFDGTADPLRISPAERLTTSEDRLIEERNRRLSASPFIRALQAATDKAFGRGGR